MAIIFGPINSRRFGRSLGIDLSPSIKQCNFNCVYCELTKAKPIEEAKEIVSLDEILGEAAKEIKNHGEIDVLTITANGEPTLYPHFAKLTDELKKNFPEQKLLVLTNATRIRENFDALLKFNIVKCSLDSVIQKTFEKIDGTHTIQVANIIRSLQDFRKVYMGDFVLEILVVKGLNDKEEEFVALEKIIKTLNPKRIDLGSIDRPPAFNVKGVSYERLLELSKILGDLPVNIVKKPVYKDKKFFTQEEILEMLDRRPQSLEDVEKSFSKEAQKNMQALLEAKKIYIKNNYYTTH